MSVYSYSSANIFPLKLLINDKIIKTTKNGVITPVHYQLNPTNRCNFKCSFCSCGGRDRNIELPFGRIQNLIEGESALAPQSCTITGGGEPTIHRSFSEILRLLEDNNIKSGLVTNGTLLDEVSLLDSLTWIRVSFSDVLKKQVKGTKLRSIDQYLRTLEKVIDDHQTVDWSISYVLGPDPDFQFIAESVHIANEYNMTHIRLVNDILKAEKLAWTMEAVKNQLDRRGIDDKRVNYQDRSTYTSGQNPCYISLLKPVIGADGYIYPCCGTQYALDNPALDYEKSMRLGLMEDLDLLIQNQNFFNGSMCTKCYYSHYNKVLETLLAGIDHPSFV